MVRPTERSISANPVCPAHKSRHVKLPTFNAVTTRAPRLSPIRAAHVLHKQPILPNANCKTFLGRLTTKSIPQTRANVHLVLVQRTKFSILLIFKRMAALLAFLVLNKAATFCNKVNGIQQLVLVLLVILPLPAISSNTACQRVVANASLSTLVLTTQLTISAIQTLKLGMLRLAVVLLVCHFSPGLAWITKPDIVLTKTHNQIPTIFVVLATLALPLFVVVVIKKSITLAVFATKLLTLGVSPLLVMSTLSVTSTALANLAAFLMPIAMPALQVKSPKRQVLSVMAARLALPTVLPTTNSTLKISVLVIPNSRPTIVVFPVPILVPNLVKSLLVTKRVLSSIFASNNAILVSILPVPPSAATVLLSMKGIMSSTTRVCHLMVIIAAASLVLDASALKLFAMPIALVLLTDSPLVLPSLPC